MLFNRNDSNVSQLKRPPFWAIWILPMHDVWQQDFDQVSALLLQLRHSHDPLQIIFRGVVDLIVFLLITFFKILFKILSHSYKWPARRILLLAVGSASGCLFVAYFSMSRGNVPVIYVSFLIQVSFASWKFNSAIFESMRTIIMEQLIMLRVSLQF